MEGNIDIRKELKELIDNHGHWFVIRQAVPGRICFCINPITKDASPGCNTCLASGRAYVDRFTKGRKSRPVRLAQTSDMEARTSVGVAGTPEAVFYIEYYMKPAETDYILEISLDPLITEPQLPFKVNSVYGIMDSRELRDNKGRIEYFAITAQRKNWSQFEMTQ